MRFLLIVSFLAGLVFNLFGEVNYRSGNYYLEMQEFLISTGGKSLNVKRVYNSRSTRVGSFGFGWTFNFDIKLKVLPGGILLLLDEDGRKIKVETANTKEMLKNDLAALSKKIKNNSLVKKIGAEKDPEKIGYFFEKNGVKPIIPVNTVYRGFGGWRGYELLKRTSKGWIRNIGHSGEKQLFDLEGRFVKYLDPDGNYLLFSYKKDKLHTIINPLKQTATFEWNKSNLIQSIKAVDGGVYTYKYNNKKLLTEAKHPKFGLYKFDYDGLYNLTKITYPTGDTKVLGYDTKFDLVTSEKGPGRLDVKYTYGRNPKDHKHYWTVVSVPYGKGYKEIDRWEYWEDEDKYLRVTGGSKIETKFSKFGSGSPLYINRDGRVTRFKYNSIGQPIERILPNGTVIKTEYNPKFGKPAKVTEGKDIYNYTHNSKGNIVFAKNNNGLEVHITYDGKGRIRTLTNKKRGTLFFVFNELGKPIQITKKKVGVVNIKYDSGGRIIDIKTKPEGGQIATTIISIFQELFSVLKYAG